MSGTNTPIPASAAGSGWLTPSRVTAIATVLAAVGAALSHVTTGDTKIDGVVALLAFVLTHLFVPDNTKQLFRMHQELLRRVSK